MRTRLCNVFSLGFSYQALLLTSLGRNAEDIDGFVANTASSRSRAILGAISRSIPQSPRTKLRNRCKCSNLGFSFARDSESSFTRAFARSNDFFASESCMCVVRSDLEASVRARFSLERTCVKDDGVVVVVLFVVVVVVVVVGS